MKRTHYSPPEFFQQVRLKCPNISAVTVFKLQQTHNIHPSWAGCDSLFSAQQLNQILKILGETQLVEKNGFLVLPE